MQKVRASRDAIVKTQNVAPVFLSLIFSSTAIANQEMTEGEHLYELSIDQLVNVKISGATRTMKKMSEVPASVTVFGHSELQKMGIDFLFELLSYVPGFQTSRDNDYGGMYFYSSRGSDTGQDTTAILLLIDGIPRQEIRNASASELSSLFPLDRIERIEVIRGPGAALYGSGAFLGVINIITVKGNNVAKVQTGQHDRQSANIQLSQQSGDWHFDAFLSGYKDGGENYRLDDRLRTDLMKTSDPQSMQNYTLQLGYLDTLITLEHLNLDVDDYYSISTINNDRNEQQHYANHASIEQKLNWDSLVSSLKISYDTNELDYVAQATLPGQLAARSNPSSNAALIGNTRYKSHDTLLQWLNDWQINDHSSVQFGAEEHHEALTTARVLANYDVSALANRQFPVRSSANQDIYNEVVATGGRNILGLYSQLQYRLDPQTEFTVGVRYDDYRNYAEQISPRLAVTRQLNDTNFLKAFYGEAFRAPSLNQLNVKETLTVASNPNLKPERIRTSELVWLSQNSNFSFSTSAFYNTIDDSIDSSGFVNGRRINVNVGTQYSDGLEIESSFQMGTNWLVRAAFTDFFTLPDSSFRESKHLTSLILNYQKEKWWANLSGYYNSEREMPDGSTIGGFTVLNSKIGYRFSEQLTANLQIKNLTNKNFGSAAQSTNVTTPIPYRGRETSVGINYSFN